MLQGTDTLKAALARLRGAIPAKVEGELPLLAADLLDRAKELVPERTGELRDSGFVNDLGNGMVEVGFASEHAVTVHERLDYHHENGQAKFLEHPLFEMERELPERLADVAREELT